jgi:hypothetical protein
MPMPYDENEEATNRWNRNRGGWFRNQRPAGRRDKTIGPITIIKIWGDPSDLWVRLSDHSTLHTDLPYIQNKPHFEEYIHETYGGILNTPEDTDKPETWDKYLESLMDPSENAESETS